MRYTSLDGTTLVELLKNVSVTITSEFNVDLLVLRNIGESVIIVDGKDVFNGEHELGVGGILKLGEVLAGEVFEVYTKEFEVGLLELVKHRDKKGASYAWLQEEF